MRSARLFKQALMDLFSGKQNKEDIDAVELTDQEVMRNDVERTVREVGLDDQGNKAYYLSKKMPLKDADGEIIGLMGASIDITEQYLAEQAKQDFINNMRHDIRTPLAGISGIATFLAEGETDESKKELLADITTCAKELLSYCDELIAFSSVETGMVPQEEAYCSITQIINSSINTEAVAAKDKGLVIEKNLDPALPETLLGDEYRIKAILLNLLGNAIKFTNRGGAVTVSTKLVRSDFSSRQAIIKLAVKDTGLGIAKANQQRIFEKFFRVKPKSSTRYKGYGLGLRLVKQFVGEMNGEIKLESEEGVGSEFSVFLPLKLPISEEQDA